MRGKKLCWGILVLLLLVLVLSALAACDPGETGREHGEAAREVGEDVEEYGEGFLEGCTEQANSGGGGAAWGELVVTASFPLGIVAVREYHRRRDRG